MTEILNNNTNKKEKEKEKASITNMSSSSIMEYVVVVSGMGIIGYHQIVHPLIRK